jgi:hypothetical protein
MLVKENYSDRPDEQRYVSHRFFILLEDARAGFHSLPETLINLLNRSLLFYVLSIQHASCIRNNIDSLAAGRSGINLLISSSTCRILFFYNRELVRPQSEEIVCNARLELLAQAQVPETETPMPSGTHGQL